MKILNVSSISSFWPKLSSMFSFRAKKEPVRIPITKETRENFLSCMPIVFFIICGTCMIAAAVIYILLKREKTKEKEIRRHILVNEFLGKIISRFDPLFSPNGAAFAIEADSHREAVPGEIDDFCEDICPKREKTVLSIKDSSETLKVEISSEGNTDLNAAVTIHSSLQESPIGGNKFEAERIYEKSLSVSTRQSLDSSKKALCNKVKKDNAKATIAAKFSSWRKNLDVNTINGKNKNEDESKTLKRNFSKFPKRQEPPATDRNRNNRAVSCDTKVPDKKRVPISFRSKSLSPRKIENNDLNKLPTIDITMDENPSGLKAALLGNSHVENLSDPSGKNENKAAALRDDISLQKNHGSISERGQATKSNNTDVSKDTRQGSPKKRSPSGFGFSRMEKPNQAPKAAPPLDDVNLDKNHGTISERGRAPQSNNNEVSKETLQSSPKKRSLSCYRSYRMEKSFQAAKVSTAGNVEEEKKSAPKFLRKNGGMNASNYRFQRKMNADRINNCLNTDIIREDFSESEKPDKKDLSTTLRTKSGFRRRNSCNNKKQTVLNIQFTADVTKVQSFSKEINQMDCSLEENGENFEVTTTTSETLVEMYRNDEEGFEVLKEYKSTVELVSKCEESAGDAPLPAEEDNEADDPTMKSSSEDNIQQIPKVLRDPFDINLVTAGSSNSETAEENLETKPSNQEPNGLRADEDGLNPKLLMVKRPYGRSSSDVPFGGLRYCSKSLVSKFAVADKQNYTECLPVISKIPVYVSPLRRTLSAGPPVQSEAPQEHPEGVLGSVECPKNLQMLKSQEGCFISKLPVHVATLHRKSSGDFF